MAPPRDKKPVPSIEIHRYPGLSPKAYEHPADRAATKALGAIPGLDAVVRQLIELGYERAMFQSDLAGSVRLGPTQLPDVWSRWEEVCNGLDLGGGERATPTLYVTQMPAANAFAVGSKHPYCILTSGLVNITDPGEKAAVLAHEAAHMLSDHTLYRTILRILLSLGSTVIPLAGIPLFAIRLALLEWFRASELTCDRAAALVLQNPETVCRTLMVLGGGLPSNQLNADAFMAQAAEYEDWDDGPDRIRRFLGQLSMTHSLPVRRAGELMRWIGSGDYDRIVRGDYPTTDREPGVGEVSADAVSFYADRFRSIFNSAGESVSTMGRRFADWARGGDE